MERAQFETVRDMVVHRRKRSSSSTSHVHMGLSLFSGFPLHPTSLQRIMFDAMCVLFLMLDSILVPVVIAWNTALTGMWRLLGWTIVAFWTLDLLLNFCTGYTDGSALVMSWKAIAKRYLSRGFVVDLLVLAVDYTELIALALFPDLNQSSLTVLKVLRSAKITRLFRLVAKLRLGLLARIDAMFSYWLQLH
eukprot:1657983-Amphidinium_carterae.1